MKAALRIGAEVTVVLRLGVGEWEAPIRHLRHSTCKLARQFCWTVEAIGAFETTAF
jgi:hypothetical protein